MTLSIIMGFVAEIFLFFIAGFMLGDGYLLSSMFYFALALSCAWWVGLKIQKQAVEKYKRENGI